jgi:thiamine-phosphate pyrophosphorylase
MRLRGYYAILDIPRDDAGDGRGGGGPGVGREQAIARAIERATRLLAARPCMLQIRAKGAGAADLAALARAVLPAARAAGVPLCVNDRLDVALAVGADAVHLGQDDLPLAEARGIARGRLVIGISTHNPEQARAAIAGGADYIGFGPIFATTTKANPDPVVGIEALSGVVGVAAGAVPLVAIGGISLLNVAEVASAGASAAALIRAVEGEADPTGAGRAINEAFREG